MRPVEFRQTRQLLQFTQDQLASRLKTTRRSIIRYEDGSRRIPGMAEVATATPGDRLHFDGRYGRSRGADRTDPTD